MDLVHGITYNVSTRDLDVRSGTSVIRVDMS